MHKILISIVSHGQGFLIKQLFEDLNKIKVHESIELSVVLTLNKKEDESFLQSLEKIPLKVIHNKSQKGFGENHNQAFLKSKCDYFLILNPDVRIGSINFQKLIAHADKNSLVSVKVLNSRNEIENSFRDFPTIKGTIKRLFTKPKLKRSSEEKMLFHTDWVAGMFIFTSACLFKDLNGFDQDYFMYYEDVDLCFRAKKKSYECIVDFSQHIYHDAQRESHQNVKYLFWHLSSMFRFFIKRSKFK